MNITAIFTIDCAIWQANRAAFDLNFRASLAYCLNVPLYSISETKLLCGSSIVSTFLLNPSGALTIPEQVQSQLSTLNLSNTVGSIASPLAGLNPIFSFSTVTKLTPAPTMTPTFTTSHPTYSPTGTQVFYKSFLFGVEVVIGVLIVIALIVITTCCTCNSCPLYPARASAEKEAARRLSKANQGPFVHENELAMEMVNLAEPVPLESRALPPGWKKCFVEDADGSQAYVGAPYYFHEWKGWSEWDLEAVFAHAIELPPVVAAGPAPVLFTDQRPDNIDSNQEETDNNELNKSIAEPEQVLLSAHEATEMHLEVRRMSRPPEHVPRRLSKMAEQAAPTESMLCSIIMIIIVVYYCYLFYVCLFCPLPLHVYFIFIYYLF